MKYSVLVDTLERANKRTHTLDLPDGTRVLTLIHGGRVLGLFSRNSDENAYWTHPALCSADSAIALYSSGAWENSGGDRTWLAPELDLFFPNYPNLDMEGYVQPRQLDPGNYRLQPSEVGTFRIANQFSLELFRSKTRVELELTKQIVSTSNPLRHEPGFSDFASVDFFGYEQRTTLRLLRGTGRVGLWSLVQMPHGGEMIIPTLVKSQPTIYFGDVDREKFLVGDNCVRWTMQALGEQKIGVRAVASAGRVGYLYHADGTSTLIVRNFFVNPAGHYIDTPWTDQEDFGYGVQACNVNSSLGCFSELEYHVPAIGEGTGLSRCEDVSQVWAFRGSWTVIEEVSRRLLGTSAA